MGVAVANLTARPMDNQLGALIAGNFPPTIDGLLLGIEKAADAVGTTTTDSPLVAVGNNVMRVFVTHTENLLIKMISSVRQFSSDG